MIDAAKDALAFMHGRRDEDLRTDRQLAMALVKSIEIIGEAAARISEPTRQNVPGLRWEKMVGMRHVLVHNYYDVDLDVLCRTVRDELPGLIVLLEAAVKDDDAGQVGT